jgi:hypothetical protein
MTELGAVTTWAPKERSEIKGSLTAAKSVNWIWLVDATLSLAEIRFGLLYGSNAGRRLKRSKS